MTVNVRFDLTTCRYFFQRSRNTGIIPAHRHIRFAFIAIGREPDRLAEIQIRLRQPEIGVSSGRLMSERSCCPQPVRQSSVHTMRMIRDKKLFFMVLL